MCVNTCERGVHTCDGCAHALGRGGSPENVKFGAKKNQKLKYFYLEMSPRCHMGVVVLKPHVAHL